MDFSNSYALTHSPTDPIPTVRYTPVLTDRYMDATTTNLPSKNATGIAALATPPTTTTEMRTAILTAAAQLFSERGYGSTSVREVVQAAGCQKPTLYYYFKNKEDLYLQVLQTSCESMDAVVLSRLEAPGTARERLCGALQAYLKEVERDQTILRLVMAAERHPEAGQPFFDFDGLRQRHVEVTRKVLEEGVKNGELRSNVDVEEAVLGLFGMVDHRLVLMLHGRPLPGDYPERLLDLFFNGVGQ